MAIGVMETWEQAEARIAEAMQSATVDAVPVTAAVLCEDCKMISRRTRTGICGICTSSATVDLARVLNRETK